MTETPVQDGPPLDAFGSESAPGLSLIMLMRIYDVLMTQLRYDHGETISDNLLALHAQGAILGPAPDFRQFIYDTTNQDGLGEQSPSHLGKSHQQLYSSVLVSDSSDDQGSVEELADPITPDEEPLPHDSVSDKALGDERPWHFSDAPDHP